MLIAVYYQYKDFFLPFNVDIKSTQEIYASIRPNSILSDIDRVVLISHYFLISSILIYQKIDALLGLIDDPILRKEILHAQLASYGESGWSK